MKIIDLLNKIAKGEEVPKKIKIKNNVYEWYRRCENTFNYRLSYNGKLVDSYLSDDWFIDSKDMLNDEVEILEEEKKVEFKNILSLNTNICTIKRYDITDRKNKDRVVCNIRNDFENIGDTVNELIENQKKIIDYLKSKGDE